MNIEEIIELLERLDGAGIEITDLELVEEELQAMGFVNGDDEDAE